MHRLIYRRAALAVVTLLAAFVASNLPARGAPPLRAMPPQRQPIVTPRPVFTNNSLLNAALTRYVQNLPSERNLAASLAGNPTLTPFSGLSYVPPYKLPEAVYWQSVYSVPYWAPLSPYSMYMNSVYMNSMYGYGSPYSGYGASYPSYGSGGYGGGGAPNADAGADYSRTNANGGARLERRELPTGPLSGLMNAEGVLNWPLALRILPPAPEAAELRRSIESRAAELQAGKADDRLVRDLNRDLDRLTTLLAEKGDRLPVSDQATNDARTFLRKMREALKGGE